MSYVAASHFLSAEEPSEYHLFDVVCILQSLSLPVLSDATL